MWVQKTSGTPRCQELAWAFVWIDACIAAIATLVDDVDLCHCSDQNQTADIVKQAITFDCVSILSILFAFQTITACSSESKCIAVQKTIYLSFTNANLVSFIAYCLLPIVFHSSAQERRIFVSVCWLSTSYTVLFGITACNGGSWLRIRWVYCLNLVYTVS